MRDRGGEWAGDRLLAERVEPLGIAADRPVLDESLRHTTVTDKSRERDREGGQADIGDPEGVVEAGENSDQKSRQNCDRHRRAVLEEKGHHAGGEAHDRSHRKIDIRADDDERHRQSDDALFNRELEEIDEIARTLK